MSRRNQGSPNSRLSNSFNNNPNLSSSFRNVSPNNRANTNGRSFNASRNQNISSINSNKNQNVNLDGNVGYTPSEGKKNPNATLNDRIDLPSSLGKDDSINFYGKPGGRNQATDLNATTVLDGQMTDENMDIDKKMMTQK